MMAVVGRILVFLGCAALGVHQGQDLRRRTACLEQFRGALSGLSREVAFSLRPLPELAQEIAREEDPPVSDFFQACRREFLVSGGESWAESWQKTLHQMKLPLHSSDFRILREAGEVLGRYDGPAQQQALTGILTRLERAAEEARGQASRLVRVYVVLGICAGLFWIILLW